MKGVLLEVSPEELVRRHRLGLDRHDEMWEGVLHMSPAPAYEHQRILDDLLTFLKPLLRRRGRGTMVSGINVFDESSPTENYRIPDLTFVKAGRENVLAEDGIRGGAPDCVVEVRSPGDESYEKLPFFAALGVREVVILARDTKQPEVFRLAGRQYLAVASDADGWTTSETMRVRFRTTPGNPPRLAVADLDEPASSTEI